MAATRRRLVSVWQRSGRNVREILPTKMMTAWEEGEIMADDEILTVRELATEPKLRLVAGESAIDKAITGIHATDLPDPTPWMTTGDVLLTAGPTFACDTQVGVRLVEQLAAIESAALCVATGYHIETIPDAMIERAESLKLPVLEVPHDVPTRSVVGYVYHALASGDLHRLRRTVRVQNHLLDLMSEEKDVRTLLEGIASLLDMPLTLFDSRGTVLAHAGERACDDPPEYLWDSYASLQWAAGRRGVVESGQSRYYFRDVEMFGKVERVLAAASPHGVNSEFIEMSLDFLERLLTLDLLRQRDELAMARRMRRRLLRELLSDEEQHDDLASLLARQGISPEAPWRLAICRVPEARLSLLTSADQDKSRREIEDTLTETVEQLLVKRRVPFLCMPDDSRLVLLLSLADTEVSSVLEVLEELGSAVAAKVSPAGVSIGCSGVRIGWTSPARALHEAEDACLPARRGDVGASIVLFEDITGRFRLLQGLGDEALRDVYERTIAPLAESDEQHHTRLVETLAALLEHRFAAQATADALYIHRNTLQKRLQRIEHLLGVDLERLDDVFELYLGLRASELLGHRVGAPTPARRRSTLAPARDLVVVPEACAV